MSGRISAGMTATLIGITTGFVALVGLYLSFVGGDPTTGVVLLAITPALLAMVPVATRNGDCARR